jgi:AcrR family transcriptional regulator
MTLDAPSRQSAPRKRRPAARAGAPAAADTREIILETAERMFAERGFANVSVRDLTTEAGVNIASINYYFGSKDRLLYEVFRRRVKELTEERMALLQEAEAKGNPSVRDILYAMIAPSLRWRDPASGRTAAVKFLVRARNEGTPQIKRVIDTKIAHLEAFRDALARALPHLSYEELCWRLHFTLTMMHHFSVELERLANLSGGACDVRNIDALINRIVDFAAAGFLAGAPAGERRP